MASSSSKVQINFKDFYWKSGNDAYSFLTHLTISVKTKITFIFLSCSDIVNKEHTYTKIGSYLIAYMELLPSTIIVRAFFTPDIKAKKPAASPLLQIFLSFTGEGQLFFFQRSWTASTAGINCFFNSVVSESHLTLTNKWIHCSRIYEHSLISHFYFSGQYFHTVSCQSLRLEIATKSLSLMWYHRTTIEEYCIINDEFLWCFNMTSF